ncbi:hypothetical protein [Ruegeria arenilitoris]|uniref:hypothetical protein n=1 Tax=Ruegeria arenilitoris TaxID=1173585 RepID=UPI00147D31D4|nr:hypothetical protein [Ruegeria arenilitoris]
MSNTSFQDRIQRINANNPQATSDLSQKVTKAPSLRPNHWKVLVGILFLSAGQQAVKQANESYEVIKQSYGIGAAAGLGVAGVFALVAGCILMYRGILAGNKQRNKAISGASETGGRRKRITSNRARTICSIVGFSLGAIATFYLITGKIAHSMDTESAREYALGASVIMIGLPMLSLLIGFIGLFVRGFALGRVPVFCVLGAFITICAIILSGANPYEWNWLFSRLH